MLRLSSSTMTVVSLKCFVDTLQISRFELSLLFCVQPQTHHSSRASLLRSVQIGCHPKHFGKNTICVFERILCKSRSSFFRRGCLNCRALLSFTPIHSNFLTIFLNSSPFKKSKQKCKMKVWKRVDSTSRLKRFHAKIYF